MINIIKKIARTTKSDLKYLYLKNMPSSRYQLFLKKEYKKRTGMELNIEKPQTFTKKIQYSKLYDSTYLKTILADKYLVREWVSNKIGSEYLIPLLGVWDNYSEVDFETLPESFVLKTNHGAGTNLIVENKNLINHFKEKIKFDRSLNRNYAYMGGLELHYKDIVPKIIAEEYIEDSTGELNDYKFLCFDGKPYYCWVDIGRYSSHYRNTYDMNWNLQPWNYNQYTNYPTEIPKPKNFEKMVNIATILSEDFSHVRVDLYNVDSKIYFGEMTFTSEAGFASFYPSEYDYKIGELWDISKIKKNKS